MVDTILVHRFNTEGLHHLFADLGQKRDVTRDWDTVHAEIDMEKAFAGGHAGEL